MNIARVFLYIDGDIEAHGQHYTSTSTRSKSMGEFKNKIQVATIPSNQ
jgi:hypothetical protein